MFSLKSVKKDLVTFTSKGMPECVVDGKQKQVIDKDYFEVLQKGDLKNIPKYVQETPNAITVPIVSQKTLSIHYEKAKIQGDEASMQFIADLSDEISKAQSHSNFTNSPGLSWNKTINCQYPARHDINLPKRFARKSPEKQEQFLKALKEKDANVFGENQMGLVNASQSLNDAPNNAIVVVRAGELRTDILQISASKSNKEFLTQLENTNRPLKIEDIKQLAKDNKITDSRIKMVDISVYSGSNETSNDQLQIITNRLIETKVLPLRDIGKTTPEFTSLLSSLSAEGYSYTINFCLNLAVSDSFVDKLQIRLNETLSTPEYAFLRDANIQVLLSKIPDNGAGYMNSAEALANISKSDIIYISLI